MAVDREKVLKGLAACTNGANKLPNCVACPYTDETGVCQDIEKMHQDALTLLREERPKDEGLRCRTCVHWKEEDCLPFPDVGWCDMIERRFLAWDYCSYGIRNPNSPDGAAEEGTE